MRRPSFALVFFLLAGSAASITATGCATAELSAGGARVVSVYQPPAGQCQPLGMVTGQGGGAGGGAWVSNDDLLLYAMNDLRNNAATMGATHVQSGPPQLGGTDGTTTTASVVGTAYRCTGQ